MTTDEKLFRLAPCASTLREEPTFPEFVLRLADGGSFGTLSFCPGSSQQHPQNPRTHKRRMAHFGAARSHGLRILEQE
jgi:hypothetical protein